MTSQTFVKMVLISGQIPLLLVCLLHSFIFVVIENKLLVLLYSIAFHSSHEDNMLHQKNKTFIALFLIAFIFFNADFVSEVNSCISSVRCSHAILKYNHCPKVVWMELQCRSCSQSHRKAHKGISHSCLNSHCNVQWATLGNSARNTVQWIHKVSKETSPHRALGKPSADESNKHTTVRSKQNKHHSWWTRA